jgi:AraC-like DNA-binding protein
MHIIAAALEQLAIDEDALVGLREQTSFLRAFRRWVGESSTSHRERALAGR